MPNSKISNNLFSTYNNLYFPNTLVPITHNVLGNWRFASPDRGLRSKTRVGKMWVREVWERAKRPT